MTTAAMPTERCWCWLHS